MSKEEFIESVTTVSVTQDADASPDYVEKADQIIEVPPVSPTDSTTSVDKATGKKSKKDKKKKKDGKKDEEELGPKVSYLQLYRFATPFDMLCITLGVLCGLATGVGQPLVALLMGDVIQKMQGSTADASFLAGMISDLRTIVIKFTVIGAILFLTAYGQMCFFTLAAENQTKLIREKYLHAIMRQDVSWHDIGKKSESLNTRLNSDTQLIFDGMADKIGMCVMSFATFISGFAIAFASGWRMTLVLMCAVPVMGACGALMAKYTMESSSDGQDSYAVAGALAEQAIGSIRTVVAFNGQEREQKRFDAVLGEAYTSGVKKAFVTGAGMGSFMFVMFCSYALAFWFGSREVRAGHMESGQVLTVLFSSIIGAFSIGNVGPNIGVIAKAQAAAYTIFNTIDRVPSIDSASEEGLRPEKIQGHIVLRDVDFSYPSRPDVPVLKKMSIEIKPGQTVALVGHSGSGKSTIVGLVERFYDVLEGSITIDGVEVKDFNVSHLRNTVGLVSQEPVLFNATIKQNILYGAGRGKTAPTEEEIIAACKLSNAHDFISKLPLKYNTMVGEKGALLSGGQKQRIAIARALIKNPRILLLDEATSALDTESERIVQAALDNAATGRSTIVIAHRLSTIMNADFIYVMDKGIVVESGTHESLLALGGTYAEFVAKQQLKSGGQDVDNELILAEAPETPASPKVAIADSFPPGARPGRKSTVGSLLRRKSSQHSVTRSHKSLDLEAGGVDAQSLAPVEELTEAQRKKEAARLLKLQQAPIGRTLGYMRLDWHLGILGCFFAIIQGALFPTFSQVFAKALTALTKAADPDFDFTHEMTHYSLLFLLLAVVGFVGFAGAMATLMIVGERLTRRMRSISYRAILSQEMGFFDRPENSTGALAARLATDAEQMYDMVSQVILTTIASIATIACGLTFSLIATWQMTLIILAAVPFIGLAQYLEIASLTGFGEKTRKAYEKSGQVAGEAIANIRTVASLAKEDEFERRYFEVTREPHQYAINKALYASIGFAISQAVGIWAYSIGFYGGYRLIEAGTINVDQMFRCMFGIVFMAMSLGHITSELPKYVKGKQSAINIYELLDKQTTIDSTGQGVVVDHVNGAVALEKVDFAYPTRLDNQVFKNVDIKIQPSQTVALVGPSGCGKSTIIALIERWYDALGGKAVVDAYNIKELQLNNIRKSMALVGQEPVLFDYSIRENILYGLEEGEGSQEQVEKAAQMANIHNFVMSLPKGYDTTVGDKGSQLSGGQKQRIAIARALIRNPRILLLDEATSALDSESEKLVQEALDKARAGRTTIVIAHRLSTIQDADLICVVKDGNIVESGKHYELIALGGVYAELCKAQNLTH